MTLAPYLAALVIIGILYGIATRQRRPGKVRRRTEEHEALLAFLEDIASDPQVVDAMLRRRGVTPYGLWVTLDNSGGWSEKTLRAVLAEMLSDRIVRRQVAKLVERRGGDRHKVMRELGELMTNAEA